MMKKGAILAILGFCGYSMAQVAGPQAILREDGEVEYTTIDADPNLPEGVYYSMAMPVTSGPDAVEPVIYERPEMYYTTIEEPQMMYATAVAATPVPIAPVIAKRPVKQEPVPRKALRVGREGLKKESQKDEKRRNSSDSDDKHRGKKHDRLSAKPHRNNKSGKHQSVCSGKSKRR